MNGIRSLHIRFPDDLHEYIETVATREHRSFNAQVIVVLERWREDNSPKSLPKSPSKEKKSQ